MVFFVAFQMPSNDGSTHAGRTTTRGLKAFHVPVPWSMEDGRGTLVPAARTLRLVPLPDELHLNAISCLMRITQNPWCRAAFFSVVRHGGSGSECGRDLCTFGMMFSSVPTRYLGFRRTRTIRAYLASKWRESQNMVSLSTGEIRVYAAVSMKCSPPESFPTTMYGITMHFPEGPHSMCIPPCTEAFISHRGYHSINYLSIHWIHE